MMLDTADNKIYFPRFYDIDTICSYDNSGQLKFDVDIEMEQGYWNTSSSRLWTRIRDLMYDDIVATYNNMRQNGVSYENMMKYIYDEQIAKIPQTYYNKDYDIKYAPFADSYIGMAHGDTYEHVKRWLKQRFTFVDTLFDYAPSYNNDVLTIRANTTELMTLEIETYTPVYQHLSWYNGQMDKKKIDGKVSVEFSGTAQAATDQEVLIYGGSNVKSIKGITSMNPNRMLIGSATKLVEIDAHDCPLLADINANKANLSPHEYLNKVNLSNCPLLEGNLKLNNSPLVQELDIRGTNITGMNLPGSIRNLQVLRLPNTMTELTLNDANMLHTLEFDEGVNLQSISMTNCNALENVTGFDLLQTPSITLNNSYNTVAELYFRDTTNLSLSNMSNLERVIFTPNAEYETFELINVANAPDYKVATFNCPKLNTFMTTAPYRESFNNCGTTTIPETIGTLICKDYSPNGTEFSTSVPFDYYNDVIEAEIDLTNCEAGHTNENILSFATTEVALGTWGNTPAIHIYYTPSSKTLTFNYHANSYNINKIIADTIVNIKMDKGTIYLNNEIVLEGSIFESSFSPSTTILIGSKEGSVRSTALYKLVGVNYGEIDREIKDYGNIQPNITFTANSIDISNTQFTDVKLLCTTDTNTLKLPTTVKNFYCDSSFDLDTDWLEDGEYDVVHGELIEPYTTDYEGEINRYIPEVIYYPKGTSTITTDFIKVQPGTDVSLNRVSGGFGYTVRIEEYKSADASDGNGSTSAMDNVSTTLKSDTNYIKLLLYSSQCDYNLTLTRVKIPNLIPSSADGSLIFSMYAPSNAVAPSSGTWDLKGLEFDNFHTYGMNNDVKPSDDLIEFYSDKLIAYNAWFWGSNSGITITPTSVTSKSNILILLNKVALFGQETKFTITAEGNKVVQGGYFNANTSSDKSSGHSGTNGVTSYTWSCHADTPYLVARVTVDDNVEWIQINNKRFSLKNVELRTLDSVQYIVDENVINVNSPTQRALVLDDIPTSITMPARYDDYNITIKNANISPKTHNTMLYPLLVNEDNPIEGKLDYTNYEGNNLSWSFAYVNMNKVNIVQPKDELLNTYEYRYNAFYETEYEFDDPNEVLRYITSSNNLLPTFNEGFTYTYDKLDNNDGTYIYRIYANDPTLLTSFELEKVPYLRITNAENLLSPIDLTKYETVSISESYYDITELYFREATNLTLTNMPYLERVIYLPNDEYEVFEIINVVNSKDYIITTSECPRLTTFMTTASHRESYNNEDVIAEVITEFTNTDNELFTNEYVFSKTYWEEDGTEVQGSVNLLHYEIPSIEDSVKAVHMIQGLDSTNRVTFFNDDKFISCEVITTACELDFKLHRNCNRIVFICEREGIVSSVVESILTTTLIKEYGSVEPNIIFNANTLDISNTQFTDVKLLCTTDLNTLKLPTTVKNFYCDSSFDLDTDYLTDGEYDVVHGELVEQYTTDYEGEIKVEELIIDEYTLDDSRYTDSYTEYFEVTPRSVFIVRKEYNFTYPFTLYEYDVAQQEIKSTEITPENVTISEADIILSDNTRYVRCRVDYTSYVLYTFIYQKPTAPNLIPSSSDGSLIFSMYAPSKAPAPASNTWDLYGLEFDNFHTYGMNNNVKGELEVKELRNNTTIYRMLGERYAGTSLYDISYGTLVATPGSYSAGCSISPILLDEDITSITITTSNGCGMFHYYSDDFNGTTATIQAFSGGTTDSGYPRNVASNTRLRLITFSNNTDLEWFDMTLVGNETKTIRYYMEDMIIVDVTDETDERRKTWNTVSYDTIYETTSLTMPSRYNNYNVTIKNANIKPKEYNTMLYPLLVNEDNPIEGKLDYTDYNGEYLSWSFAYTNTNKVNIIQPKDELLNSYEYRYNAFYKTEYEFNNPNEVMEYTTTSSDLLPIFNEGFTYAYDKIDNDNGTYTYKIYANDILSLTSFELEKVPYLRIVNAENLISPIDLTKYEVVEIDNSYNSISELYFKDATDLTLNNIPNLEKVIYVPNSEYDTFELINITNAPNYNIVTFNCPKLSTFMTTAPYRESYMINAKYLGLKLPGKTRTELEYIQSDGNQYFNTGIVPKIGDVIIMDLDMDKRSGVNYDYFIGGNVIAVQFNNAHATQLSVRYCTITPRETAVGDIPACNVSERNTYTVNITSNEDHTLKIFAGAYQGTFETINKGAGKLYSFKYYSNNRLIRDYIPCKDENDIVCLYDNIADKFLYPDGTLIAGSEVDMSDRLVEVWDKNYGDIQPNITFTANSIDISNTQFTDVKLLCTTDTNTLKLPTTVKNFYCDSSFDLDTYHLEDGEYDVVHSELVEQYTTDYESGVIRVATEEVSIPIMDICTTNGSISGNDDFFSGGNDYVGLDYIRVVPGTPIKMTFWVFMLMQYDKDKNMIEQKRIYETDNVILHSNCEYIRLQVHQDYLIEGCDVIFSPYAEYTPNLIPSSADGSLIFSMYAPNKTVAPVSGTWDLKGLKFDNFHTFGMNNDVKGDYGNVLELDITNLEKFEYLKLHYTGDDGFATPLFSRDYDCITPFYIGANSTVSVSADNEGKVSIQHSVNAISAARSEGEGVVTVNSGNPYIGISFNKNALYIYLTIDDTQYIIPVGDIPYSSNSNPDKSYFREHIMDFNDIPKGIPKNETPKSITMPARYDDYNITIKNADISPKTHNTMLYPLLVNEDKPITGTLDYTNYAGKYLSWSFAYTDEEYVDIIQPKDELINSYKYKYNAYYKTEYEFDNPYEIARYTSSASGLLPTFNSEFTYTYDEIDNEDGTYTIKIYADSFNNLPTSIKFDQLYANDLRLLTVDKLQITSAITNMRHMFRNNRALTHVNTDGWDTSNVIDMNEMFCHCYKLTSLDVSNFNTDKLIDMGNMFIGCSSLTSLDLRGFNTSNVTYMGSMFQNCNNLTSLDVSGFDTSNATSMTNMFYDCNSLTSLDVSGFDTSNVTNMQGMFQNCNNLTSLDVSGFDTSNVTNMAAMFIGCSKLTSLDVSGFDTGEVTDMEGMFQRCSSLKEAKGIENWDCSKVVKFGSMFQGATAFGGDLDLRNWKVGQNTTVTTIFSFMNGCANLKSVDMSGWIIPDNTNFANFMANQSSLHTVKVIGWSAINIQNICSVIGSYVGGTIYGDVIIDETYLKNDWVYCNVLEVAIYTANASGLLPNFNTEFTYTHAEVDNGDGTYTTKVVADSIDNLPTNISFYTKSALLSVERMNVSKVTSAQGMFYQCNNVTYINSSDWDTSSMTTMNNMFNGCKNLTSLDVSGFNTDNVTNMMGMFSGCSGLTSLDVSGFDTSSVTTMASMFNGCKNLTSLDVSNFNTTNVTTMANMFADCSSLTTLDVSDFDTSKVANMSGMFKNCNKLIALNVSNFNTSKVTIMGEMFSGCNVLSIEGLGNWDVKNVTDIGSMFLHCRGITSLLEISDWDTSSLKDLYRTFMGCTELIELDVSNWNASRLESLHETFYDCKKIISFNLGNWDCRRVTSMYGAFFGCTSLSSITLPKEVSKGCNSFSAFRNCTNLKEVTLPKGVGDIAHIFNNCNNLEKAVIPLDNINNTQDSTFNNCRALIDVDWVGDLSNNFNIITNTGEHITTESDVHELMTNLGDLKKDRIKISLSKGTIKVNDTEKTIE